MILNKIINKFFKFTDYLQQKIRMKRPHLFLSKKKKKKIHISKFRLCVLFE